MLNVALTGNAAAGKSTVVELFRSWGATIIDADAIVRDLQAPDTPVFAAIRERFGSGVVRHDGTLDRAALRTIVMTDAEDRAALNAIVHPAVLDRRATLLTEAAARGDMIVINDIPLLFETAGENQYDIVVLVDAPVPIRRARLIVDRGMQPEEADQLIGAQLPASPKRIQSDIVIENDSTRAALEKRAVAAWDRLLDLARGPG